MTPKANPISLNGDLYVPDGVVWGSDMSGWAPRLRATPRGVPRTLDLRSMRKHLHSPPHLRCNLHLQVIFDESGSVTGGNDTVGLRHQVVLIACEHLATASGRGIFTVSISTFDSPSVFDLPPTRIDRSGLRVARDVLLRASPGGSSILGPSLKRAEEAKSQVDGAKRILVVLSDFELYDPDPQDSLNSFVNSSASEVLALSLNNEPPQSLVATRARTARILQADPPAQLANHIIDAARAVVASR